MKFLVSSTTLLKQLQTLSGVLTSSNALPILDNFLFEIDKGEMLVTATDLETTMTTKIAVKSDKSGKIAVPAKMLIDTLKTFPEIPLSLSIDTKTFNIDISAGEGKYKLTGHNGDEYPKTPDLDGGSSVTINSFTLANAINKTIFANSRQSIEIAPPVSIVVGNAAGLSMSFNNKPIDLAPHTRSNIARVRLD